jgi:hypothetical protein
MEHLEFSYFKNSKNHGFLGGFFIFKKTIKNDIYMLKLFYGFFIWQQLCDQRSPSITNKGLVSLMIPTQHQYIPNMYMKQAIHI